MPKTIFVIAVNNCHPYKTLSFGGALDMK